MQAHWPFKAASWTYFGIAAIFLFALLAGPSLTERSLTPKIAGGGIVVVVFSVALGVWSRRVYFAQSQPTRIFFSATLVPYLIIGSLTNGIAMYVILGVPLLLVAMGMRQVKLQERLPPAPAPNDG